MVYESTVPLRISLAGGGTDVSPYCDRYGGAVLNAAISLYARSTLAIHDEPHIVLEGDGQPAEIHPLSFPLPVQGNFCFAKGVINRLHRDYRFPQTGFRLSSTVDVPMGSGLGTSSTLVVSLISVCCSYLGISLNAYELAHYAYDIERNDLRFAGGRQDQYAAVFGGINYMTFHTNGTVTVEPLKLDNDQLAFLQNNIVLYYTTVSRQSADIICEQQHNVKQNKTVSIEAMHHIKTQAGQMKETLLYGHFSEIGAILDIGFREKKKMAANISNAWLDDIYNAAVKAGAAGGKISGAGGGGFMFFYCPGNSRAAVEKALLPFGGEIWPFSFSMEGQQCRVVQETSRQLL